MIQTIFPVKILIKDYDLSEDWNHTVSAFVKQKLTQAIIDRGSFDAAVDEDLDVFTEKNMSDFPQLRELFDMFIDSFYQLSQEFNNKNEVSLTKEDIKKHLSLDIGKLPIMRYGQSRGIHSHTHASAFGIFYLNDVDNESEGGKLILHDPTFNSQKHFCDYRTMEVETKKHRMIIAPNTVWHEVTTYLGKQERLAIVLNLHV